MSVAWYWPDWGNQYASEGEAPPVHDLDDPDCACDACLDDQEDA